MYNFVASDDPILQSKIKETLKITKNQKKQISEMKKLLAKTDSVLAISANQIGIDDLRVFVCKNGDEITAIINPKIIWSSTDDVLEIIQDEHGVLPKSMPMWEGCISFPGKNYLVTRPYAIKVEYMNEKLVYKTATLSDQWARLFCHEIDHLNGMRIIDRAEEIMDAAPGESTGFYPTKETT